MDCKLLNPLFSQSHFAYCQYSLLLFPYALLIPQRAPRRFSPRHPCAGSVLGTKLSCWCPLLSSGRCVFPAAGCCCDFSFWFGFCVFLMLWSVKPEEAEACAAANRGTAVSEAELTIRCYQSPHFLPASCSFLFALLLWQHWLTFVASPCAAHSPIDPQILFPFLPSPQT